MQRLSCVALIVACCLLAGCNRQAPTPRDVANPGGDANPVVPVQPVVSVSGPGSGVHPADDTSRAIDAIVANLTVTSNQDQYDAALLKALGLLADKKYAEALATLETARSLRDGEQIQGQIERVKTLLAQQAAADRTVQDIRAVLNDGKADEAAKLSTTALEQFGGSDAAEDLTKLKRQADALNAAPTDDRAARRNLYMQEALAAMKDNNLRNAAIAYEQVLQTGDDANLRRDLDDVRARLTRYDDGRRRAAELRHDANDLEDALAALGAAREAWDTPQVRAEMDECQLWLEKRRDRVSVADFEVRGDVGLALAGRAVAEEMLPAFKSKFDLVEREQLGKVLDELRLEGSALADNPDGRLAVGRLAKVRYLVVGSLTPLCGVTINARLVDVRTGLVVQTARYSAPTMEALLHKLPLVAQMLTMSDDQMLALEQQLAQQPFAEVRPIIIAPPPPPPVVVVNEPPPPPIITYTPRPPVFGGLVIEDFRRPPPPPVVEVEFRRDDPRRQRLFQLSIELGDNLFRRGQYQEAHRHFEVALTLADDRRDIDVRIGRCKPFLPPPPPPPVVVVVAPPPFVRPRAIVFNFFVNCPPGLVPPAVGDWAADNFASYLTGSFEIVERGEVCWYMGRLGITMRDVMNDAGARRALAQALNVRFMVFSAIEETHSLNVTTQLVDADTGARTGTGSIHVQDHDEMKLRMQELANQIAAPKDQQAKLAKQGQDNEQALNEARRLQKAGDNAKAAGVAQAALKQNPNNVALRQLAQENDKLAQQAAAEQARKKDAERRQAELTAAQKRQAELAQQADAARLRAEQDAKSRTEAAKREQEAKQQRAYDQLMTQGRDALKRNDYTQAVQSFQGATALKPSDDGFKELAQAKAKQDQAVRARAADEQAKRDAEVKRQHDAELARAADERKKKDAEDALKRKAQDDHDRAEVARLLGVAKDQLAKQQFDAARATVQTARQIHPGADIDNLTHLIQEQQDLAAAQKKGEQARLDAEKKLADERKQRELAAAEAKKKQDAYSAALKQAQDAVAAKQYDKAVGSYQEAGKLFKTDAVLSGQRQAEELRHREKAQADAGKRKQEEDAKRDVQVKKLLADGQKALDAKQYDQALAQFREAGKLVPGNVEVLTAVGKAEQARDQYAAANRAKLEDEKKAAFNKLLTDGKTALAAKRYDDAVKTFTDAVHTQPQDAAAQDLLRQAEKGRNDAKQTSDVAVARKRDEEQRAEKVRQYVAAAHKAIEAKDLAAATQAWGEANKLAPNDPAVVQIQQDLGAARKSAGDAELAKKKKADYDLAMGAGQAALKQKNYQGAVNSFNEALRAQPGDPAAAKAQKEAQAALDAAKTPPPNNAAEYKKQMDSGAALEKQKKFTEALAAYREALKLMPGDAKAAGAVKWAEFEVHMTEGQRLIDAKKFPDAVKEFEEATKLFPDNADAKNFLKKAKDGK